MLDFFPFFRYNSRSAFGKAGGPDAATENKNLMKKVLSPLYLLIAALIWGLSFSAQKSAGALPVFVLNAARGLTASAFLFLMIPVFDLLTKSGRRLFGKHGPDFNRSELFGGLVCGALLFLANGAQQLGINGTDAFTGATAGKAAFISALYVVIVPIYGIFLKKPVGARVWCSVALAVVGSFLLSYNKESGFGIADLILLGCAAFYALHITVIDRFTPFVDGVRLSCIQFFTAGALSALFALILGSPIDFSLIGENIFPILVLGIGASGIAYTAQIFGQRDTPPAVASLILSLESVFGVIGAAIFLGETMTPRETIGCTVVFLSVLLAQVDFKALFSRKKEK